ncbi:MAG: TraB/GumN family protein, partial [Armatimonadota bacterium]|nr:TraB/GumN family protein [Armatimonadota bacterium]
VLCGPARAAGSREAQGAALPATLEPALAYTLVDPAGRRHYLVGTIHARPAEETELPAFVSRLLEGTEAVLLEIDLEAAPRAEVFRLLTKYAFKAEGQSLKELLGDEAFGSLRRLVEGTGVSLAYLEGFQPWFVEMILTGLIVQKIGFTTQSGVDSVLATEARRRQIPVIGIESLEDQFASVAKLSIETQVRSLRQTLSDWSAGGREVRQLYESYRANDAAGILGLFQDLPVQEAEFYEKVILERNRRMAQEIVRLSADGKSYLVAVGAGHVLGAGSVAALLRERGWTVTPTR